MLTGCARQQPNLPSEPDAPPSVSARSGQLKVVSYNIAHGSRGRDAILAVLAALAADVILLQEIREQDVRPLAGVLGMNFCFASKSPGPQRNAEGLAILSRMPQFNVRTVADIPEHVCGVAVDLVQGEQRLTAVSVHLVPTLYPTLAHIRDSEHWRNNQIRALLNFWEMGGRPALILGGDFNQLPVGANYRLLTSSLSDSLATLGKTSYTCNFHGLLSRIDYIYISKEFTATDGEVLSNFKPSDHFPITATLVVK